jgi:uncharacterized protein YqiB (DUF1249 family)
MALTQGDQMLGVLALEVLEACPTTTLQVRQEHSLPWLPVPRLEVQVYHDARMAEVISAEQARRLLASTPTRTRRCTSRMKRASSTCSSANG